MGTVSITSAGFLPLPSTPPAGWPSNLTWPQGGSINGTKSYTISDADAQQMLSWIASTYNSNLPTNPSAIAILLVWLNGWMAATTNSVQQYHTTPPTVPPPISIT
jgi:hypothetical protein